MTAVVPAKAGIHRWARFFLLPSLVCGRGAAAGEGINIETLLDIDSSGNIAEQRRFSVARPGAGPTGSRAGLAGRSGRQGRPEPRAADPPHCPPRRRTPVMTLDERIPAERRALLAEKLEAPGGRCRAHGSCFSRMAKIGSLENNDHWRARRVLRNLWAHEYDLDEARPGGHVSSMPWPAMLRRRYKSLYLRLPTRK